MTRIKPSRQSAHFVERGIEILKMNLIMAVGKPCIYYFI